MTNDDQNRDAARIAALKSLSIDRSAPEATEAAPKKSQLLLAAGAGALLSGLIVWALMPVPQAPAPTVAAPVAAAAKAPAQSGNMLASGFVVARRQATVASQVVGQVAEVLVEEGQPVKKGQILATLNSDAVRADLARAEAGLKVAEASLGSSMADLAEARRVFERVNKVAASGFASDAELTRAESRLAMAEATWKERTARLSAARNDVRAANVQLARHTIRAPFDGVITGKNAQPGEIISPMSAGSGFTRTGICTIVDMSSLEIEVDVSESLIANVTAGEKAQAVLDAYPDWVIPGHVIAVIPTAARDKATVKVRVGLNLKDGRVLPDMAAKVTFLAGNQKATS